LNIGTWLNSDNGMQNGKLSIPSNVTRISRAIKAVSQDGVPQIVNYHFGVGTQGGIVDRIVSGKLLSQIQEQLLPCQPRVAHHQGYLKAAAR
jgi:hypothetical protein